MSYPNSRSSASCQASVGLREREREIIINQLLPAELPKQTFAREEVGAGAIQLKIPNKKEGDNFKDWNSNLSLPSLVRKMKSDNSSSFHFNYK